ncbi:MAG: TonB family protein [Erythrobacter sp.]|nr:TonB family protein [Erythrobacter sp.]
MNYVATSRRPNPAAMVGALGIPGAFGALLIVGLAVTGLPKVDEKNPIGVLVTPNLPDPPPPPPKPSDPAPNNPTTQTTQTPQVVTVPDTQFDLRPGPPIEIGQFPPLGEELFGTPIETGGSGLGIEPPAPPLPDPIAASPRNAPGRWITDNDYRSRWIREGREGKARFRLEISAKGRVSSCEILGSTGHAVLDVATCRLITRRARFDPAKDSSGAAVPGTFTSSVNWQIPE